MDYINKGASALNNGIDAVVQYARENGVVIAILLLVAYFVRTNVAKNPTFVEAAGGGHVLAQGTPSARNATSREEELRQVRLRQQELANERAAEAARLLKEKQEKERERKNHVAKKKYLDGGDKLGKSSTTKSTTTTTTTSRSTDSSSSASSGYNPMQPWAAHSSGYRPARRTVNRG